LKTNFMKKTLFLMVVLGAGFGAANGQLTTQTPTPAQATQTVISTSRRGGIFDTQRTSNPQTDRTRGTLIASKNPAFRKPTKEDLRLVAPAAEDTATYADFLRRPKTGLIRLLSDAGCQENANLVVAKDFCLEYKNVFGGSAFSFRTENYALGRFADVVYKGGALYAIGKMTLGFLVDLGQTGALDGVSAAAAGAQFVFDFRPPEDLPQIQAAFERFHKGVTERGFQYQRFSRLQENHTYILRSVAYRKREQRERNKPIYDDLANDERKDVIIAFRVVRFSDAEKSSVTLLWKELQRKDAAKIAVEKN
jgi:hypothetical protein